MMIPKFRNNHIRRYWHVYILGIIGIVLFFIPTFFWGNLYIVGGDDSRLYYIFPWEYLKYFSFNVISNNTLGGNLGYIPVSYSAPVIFFLLILKMFLPFANTQMIAYGVIFSVGFIFFNLYLHLWIPKKTPYTFFAGILSSFLYLFSPYIGKTYFQHQLISIYLLMVVPMCLYFFFFGVKKKNISFVILASLFYSIFSSSVLSMPWLLPLLFTLIPFFVFAVRKQGLYVLKALGVFTGITILVNFYWIIHYIIPLFQPTGELSFAGSLLGISFKQQNSDLINTLVSLNSPVNQMIGYVRMSWSEPTCPPIVYVLGAGILFTILFAGTLFKKVQTSVKQLFFVSCIGLFTAMLFVTPNFGKWNVSLFQLFHDHIPFFVMFRNMYDKFALAMSYHYAFALFVALVIIGTAVTKKFIKYGILIVIAIVVMWRAYPYIVPAYDTDQYTTHISGSLNSDYLALTGYIKSMNTSSKLLWYPMTYPGYVYISDEKISGHYYIGISPLQIFGETSDIAGFYGIQTPADPELNWKILELFRSHSYDEIGKLIQKQNIGFIIMNHETIDEYYYKFFDYFDFIAYQTEDYKNILLGAKIKDFGSRYSLYEINTSLQRSTVHVLPTIITDKGILPDITFQKIKSGKFEVTVKNANTSFEMVLMEPFNRLWNVYFTHNNNRKIINTKPTLKYDYGNSWVIDTQGLANQYPEFVKKEVDGSYSFTLEIEFWPIRVTFPAFIFSGVAMLVSVVYIFFRLWKK